MATVKTNGLIRNISPGGFEKGARYINPGLDEQVWLTSDPERAKTYARTTAARFNGEPVIFAVRNVEGAEKFDNVAALNAKVKIGRTFSIDDALPEGWYFHGSSWQNEELKALYDVLNTKTPTELARLFISGVEKERIGEYVQSADIAKSFSAEVKNLKAAGYEGGATLKTVAKTANEEFLDALVRHQIYILRYSGYVRNRMTTILNASEDELARRIRDKLRTMQGLSKPVEWQRLEALQGTLAAIRKESWDEATKFLTEQMVQLSYQEPIQLDAIFKTVLPVTVETVMPSARFLRQIALSRPFEGRLLKEWADTMAADDIRRIHSSIQAGMVAGEDMATIARRVVGTGTLRGADGVTEITRRQIQTITRTAVQHIANGARDAWFADNADILTAEQFVATLDSRTTPICRSLDGKTFPVGKGPRPPLHFNCRSLRIAAIDGTLAGDRPAKPTTEKILVKEYADKNGLGNISSRDALPRGTKGDYDKWARGRVRQLVGPIPASTSYQTWLKGQSVAFQDEVMGVTKAKLFRDGGLELDKFVHRNGDELTLRELAQKHADAFRAAGLDPSKY